MKEIKLSKGLVALVDDDDYEWLSRYKWNAHRSNAKTFVARRTEWIGTKSYEVSMHRTITNAPTGMEVDHIDHNGLNNQKRNLRICTKSQNAKNRSAYGLSKYLGVSYACNGRYIRARIYNNGRNYELGTYQTEEAAAMAYDRAAKGLHGEFANLNYK